MKLIFFALLGLNAAALALQLTVWKPEPAAPERRVAVAAATGGEPLVLLSERESAPPAAARRDEIQRASFGATMEGRDGERERLCDMLGPFGRLLDAEYMVESLAAMEVVSSVRQVAVPEGVGYWVHLPPEPSKKEALKKLREVQAKQIDSYLIPRGELANGISFGMFTRQELAEARLSDMQELGYPAEIREITRTREEVWVLLEPGQAQSLSPELWSELLGRENGVEKQQKYCSGVASG